MLRPALYGRETAALVHGCAPGPHDEDARLQGQVMAMVRDGFKELEAFALGWAMQTLGLLLRALTLTRGSAALVPRGWRSTLDVRGALRACCAAAGMAKRRAGGAAWAGAAGGVGGQGSGAGGKSQSRLQQEAEVKPLHSGCCAVLDCALRVAVREDMAGELEACAQEGVENGRAGWRRQGEAAAGPAEVEAGMVTGAAADCYAHETAGLGGGHLCFRPWCKGRWRRWACRRRGWRRCWVQRRQQQGQQGGRWRQQEHSQHRMRRCHRQSKTLTLGREDPLQSAVHATRVERPPVQGPLWTWLAGKGASRTREKSSTRSSRSSSSSSAGGLWTPSVARLGSC